MASPALSSLEGGGGGTLPPATQPVPSPMPSNGHASRPPSQPRGTATNSEPRTSQPPMPSPSLPQGQYINRGPTPTNNTLPQKSNGEGKDVSSSDEYLQLSHMVKTARPDVVRRVVRDHSQRCLTGSDFHVGFILNTTLHHASPSLLDQAVKDFGAQLVSATKHRWVQHLGPNDLDEIADALFQRASDRFLDRALARRFETISGRALVNALARAERLGYDTRDIVEEKDANKQEHVIPSPLPPTTGVFRTNGPQASQAPPQTPQYQQQPQRPVYQEPQPVFPVLRHSAEQIASAKPLGIVFCDVCGRPCSGPSALDNHLKKRACANHVTKLDRFGTETCAHCGVSFSSVGGLAYHNKSAVCGVYTPNVNKKMMELLTQRARTPNPKPAATNYMPQQGPNPGYQTPTQPAAARPTVRPDIADQYAGLSPQNQTQFDAEMKNAEDYYGQQMRDAMALPQPQADIELGKIKNRLNSRQSNLRKKYGIRLRERRTKEQIEIDNARIARASSTGTPPVSTPPMGTPQQGQSTSVSGVKRPLSSHDDSPRKRVPLSEMSGLSGAAASAEMTDPTLNRIPPATPSSLPPKPSSSLPPRPPPQQQQPNTPAAPPSFLPARPPPGTIAVPPPQAPTAPIPNKGSGDGPDNPMDIDSTTSEVTGTPKESGAISGAPEAGNGVGNQAEHGEIQVSGPQ